MTEKKTVKKRKKDKAEFPATVYRSGGSLVITIPKDYVEVLDLKPGDKVYVTIEVLE